MNERPLIIRCPNCKKSLQWDPDNLYRPFCSKRCQMADFGDWANEQIRIPGEPAGVFWDQENPPMGEEEY
jgi:hypothetical protein